MTSYEYFKLPLHEQRHYLKNAWKRQNRRFRESLTRKLIRLHKIDEIYYDTLQNAIAVGRSVASSEMPSDQSLAYVGQSNRIGSVPGVSVRRMDKRCKIRASQIKDPKIQNALSTKVQDQKDTLREINKERRKQRIAVGELTPDGLPNPKFQGTTRLQTFKKQAPEFHNTSNAFLKKHPNAVSNIQPKTPQVKISSNSYTPYLQHRKEVMGDTLYRQSKPLPRACN